MSVAISAFPQVRTVTDLVRSLLADETIAPGYPFIPLSMTASGGIVTAVFGINPGYIAGDKILITGAAPAALNGTYVLGIGSGAQIVWQNASAPNGAATAVGTIQGYGTGKKYTDTVLMAYVNSAYRGLQRALKTSGSTEFKEDEAFVTIPGISFTEPTTQVFLNYEGLSIASDADPAPTFVGGTPLGQLPLDLLLPRKLWERRTGSSNQMQEMTNLTNEGGLPSRPQGICLGIWALIGDAISFLGAQQSNDIRIEYDKSLPEVSDGSAYLQVLNSEDYHAYAVAAMAGKSRGGRAPEQWDTIAEDSKEKLVNAATRGQQFQARRSRGFSSRRGYIRRYY